MRHPLPEDVPNRARIGIMAIGRDAIRRHPSHHPCRPNKGLGRREIACIAEPHVHEVAVSINGTVQVIPLPLNFDLRFIHVPAGPHGPVAPPAQGLAEEPEPACFPTPVRLRA